jgi:hypothetical protein
VCVVAFWGGVAGMQVILRSLVPSASMLGGVIAAPSDQEGGPVSRSVSMPVRGPF